MQCNQQCSMQNVRCNQTVPKRENQPPSIETIDLRDVLLHLKFPMYATPPDILYNETSAMEDSIPITLYTADDEDKKLKLKNFNKFRSINGTNHNTFYYHLMKPPKGQALIVRRGLPFRLSFTFNRPFGKSDELFLEFALCDVETNTFAEGSLARMKIEKARSCPCCLSDKYRWYAVCDRITEGGTTIFVQVRSAEKAPLGQWTMRILLCGEDFAIASSLYRQFYIIANPWGGDIIGNNSLEVRRKEYVLADCGQVYVGYLEAPTAIAWRYGQFEKDILETSIRLLRGCSSVDRSELYRLVNHLSVLLDPEKGLTAEKPKSKPIFGSHEILKHFKKSNKPVGVLNQPYASSCAFITVCRALGIVARPVTFYNVLPDNDGGLGVDRYLHNLGLWLHNVNLTNMWMYKVLPEVMVFRPDLPQPFSTTGWQVVSQFGPVSAGAIRAGSLYRQRAYSTDYIYRMVKSAYVYFRVESATKPVKIVPSQIGSTCGLIVTKAAGNWEIDNLVSNYFENPPSIESTIGNKDRSIAVTASSCEVAVPANYTGGRQRSHSIRDRLDEDDEDDNLVKKSPPRFSKNDIPLIHTLEKNGGSIAGFYYDDKQDFTAELITSSSWWGEPLKAAVYVKNLLNKNCTGHVSLEMNTVSVSGGFLSTLKTLQKRIVLKPGVVQVTNLLLKHSEYEDELKPGDSVRVSVNVHTEEGDCDQCFEKFIGFVPLKIVMKMVDEATFYVQLINVTSEEMKKCSLSVREIDRSGQKTILSKKTLPPTTAFGGNVNITTTSPGIYFVQVCASFGSASTYAYVGIAASPEQSYFPSMKTKIFKIL